MSNGINSSQVRANGSLAGAVYTAPLGSTLPVDADATLDAAFTPLGFVSDDGVEELTDTSTSSVNAWQGAVRVRTLTTDNMKGAKFTLIQTNKSVLEAYYSTTVDGAAGAWELDLVPPTQDRRVWVIDAVDGLYVTRILFEDAEIVDRENVEHSNNNLVAYGITVEAYIAAGTSRYGKRFSNDDNWGAS